MTATHPSVDELLESVIGFIERDAAPKLADRDAFMARVAVNALNTVRRELKQGPAADAEARARLASLLGRDGPLPELEAELAERLRSGAADPLDPAVLDHLHRSAASQVAIDQPNYAGLKTAGFQG